MWELRYLRISHDVLSDISDTAFSSGASIVKLDISHNHFVSLPFRTLNKLPNLRCLDVSHNRIATIAIDNGKNSVTELTLDYLKNHENITNHAFMAFPNLSIFSMQNCPSLCHISKNAFTESKDNLTHVFLGNNSLTYLENTLLQWHNLQTFSLYGNPWNCDCKMNWATSNFMWNRVFVYA